MEFYPKNKIEIKEIRKFIIIFYAVGFLGFFVPFTQNIFIVITPFALLLCIYLLAIFHSKYNKVTIMVFASIYLLGFFIEIIGVKTGVIFGNYHYGQGLGIKLLGTPLMIGLNWLFLAYTSSSIVEGLKLKTLPACFIAPTLMVLYDLVLEQVAAPMNMWFWESPMIPPVNYISWYIIGFFMVLLIKLFKINTTNPLSSILFICQFMFLLLLSIFLK